MAVSRRVFMGGFAAATFAAPARVRAAGEPLAIGFVPANSVYWDLVVAIEKDFFRDAGFEPEPFVMESSPHSIEQARAGVYQIAASQPEPFVQAVLGGSHMLAAIAAPMSRADWCLNVQDAFSHLSQLKGKIIGVSALRSSEVWLTNLLLEKAGLNKADVTYHVVGTSPQKLAALKDGSIAAAVLFQPSAALAYEQGFPVLARYAALRPYPAIVYVVRRDWAARNENGKRAAAAIRRAHKWLWDPANQNEALTILMKTTKQDSPILAAVYFQYFIGGRIYSTTGE